MIPQDPDHVPVERRVFAELRALRMNVTGVYGSLVATSDGLLVAHDVPGMEPTRVAALVATTLGLAGQTTQATGRGSFREAVARGESGYLAVYAAGSNAVVAVIGENEMNIGMLHYEVRDMIQRITGYSAKFTRWASPARHALGQEPNALSQILVPDQSRSSELPRRRPREPRLTQRPPLRRYAA